MASTLNEHFRYLSLANRTKAYRQALQEVVRSGDTIADLGTGFGILGLLALEAGAAHCTGIDQSAAAEIAREMAEREGVSDRFTIVRSSTFDTELPAPVDLLVCDHIGYFGFDYGIIAMLADAHKRMLKPGGSIMPRAMDMHVGLVESEAMRARVARWDGNAIPGAYRWLGTREANSLHSQRFFAEEMVSGGALIASVDFRTDAPDLFRFSGALPVTRDGMVDGLCGYFTCQLSDSVSITNSPFAADAIGRANAFLPCREPFAVAAGEEVGVSLAIRHDPCIINWSITPPGGETQSMSTWHSQILTRDEFGASKV